MKVKVSKVKFGSKGEWHSEEYQAYIDGKEQEDVSWKVKSGLGSSKTLDELALKLALLTNAHGYLQLIPEQEEWISIGKIDGSYSVITQVIKPSNEELETLGKYVQGYLTSIKNAA